MREWLIARPVAHRGLHDAAAGVIENTPSAFAAAIAANYAIECDIQISADGEAMVFHDEALGAADRRQRPARRDDRRRTQARAFRGTADRMITLGELVRSRRRSGGAGDRDQEPVRRRSAARHACRRGALRLRGAARADVVRSRADRGAADARAASAARHRRRAALQPSRMEPAVRAHQARARLLPARAAAAGRNSSPIRSTTCRRRSRWLARNAVAACRC